MKILATMKYKPLLFLLAAFFGTLALSCTNSLDNLRSDFRSPEGKVRTAVYWYWLNDNATSEGVAKDLREMKRVGIDRAFIGVHSTGDMPYGDIKMFSEEWWEVLHTALKVATELDIEIGIFNCPGWSQSGGPWVTPEMSMRYVAMEPVGPDGSLPEMGEDQLISILAYPSVEASSQEWMLTTSPGREVRAKLHLDKSFVARTITLESFDTMMLPYVQLWSGGEKIADFDFDRHNTAMNVGFVPLVPHSITVPETESSEYEIVLGPDETGGGKVKVTLSEAPAVQQYDGKSLAKVFQDPLPMWDYYMWETPAEPSSSFGIIDPSEVVDLTQYVKEGKLEWNAPDGREWKVLCAYMKSTGVTNAPATREGEGLEVDKMSRRHVRTHFDAYMGEILRRIPAEDRACWTLVVQDSYETGSTNWTDDMRPEFIKVYGYDPLPYLPALYGTVVGSVDRSDRFLWDLRRLVADRVACDYVGGLAEVCHEHGLKTWLECYGHWGFPSEFLKYGGQSDQVSGEYWSEGDLGDIESKAASSCAHIYGKNEVWAESCTAGGPQYHRYPRMMKQRVDHFFCQGINASLLHLFIQQSGDRVPGLDAWFGNEFNRFNSWWDAMDLFTAYLKRCNLMLQAGDYHADVAYFTGEDAPKMTGVCNPPLPEGYSFDYINAEILCDAARVVDCRLVLDSGMSYDVLVLPDQKTMRPEVLEAIASLISDGLTVLGPAPEKSPSLKNYGAADSSVRALASEVWNPSGRYGKGRVFPEGTSLETVLAAAGCSPDVEGLDGAEFIHRTLGRDGDVYFVANTSEQSLSISPSFKVDASRFAPELWHPVTGVCEAASCRVEGGRVVVDLSLAELESVFVVFGRGKASDASAPSAPASLDIDGPWKVTFAESAGNPSFEREFAGLEDWALSSDPAVKFFGGHATYSCSFDMPAADRGRVVLDLGKVMVMGKVYVNGKYAGGVWTEPYSVDITDFVKDGPNSLEVTAYNNWRNRLVGDASLPESERGTWTNINPWQAGDDLQPSGLLGPVRITY